MKPPFCELIAFGGDGIVIWGAKHNEPGSVVRHRWYGDTEVGQEFTWFHFDTFAENQWTQDYRNAGDASQLLLPINNNSNSFTSLIDKDGIGIICPFDEFWGGIGNYGETVQNPLQPGDNFKTYYCFEWFFRPREISQHDLYMILMKAKCDRPCKGVKGWDPWPCISSGDDDDSVMKPPNEVKDDEVIKLPNKKQISGRQYKMERQLRDDYVPFCYKVCQEPPKPKPKVLEIEVFTNYVTLLYNRLNAVIQEYQSTNPIMYNKDVMVNDLATLKSNYSAMIDKLKAKPSSNTFKNWLLDQFTILMVDGQQCMTVKKQTNTPLFDIAEFKAYVLGCQEGNIPLRNPKFTPTFFFFSYVIDYICERQFFVKGGTFNGKVLASDLMKNSWAIPDLKTIAMCVNSQKPSGQVIQNDAYNALGQTLSRLTTFRQLSPLVVLTGLQYDESLIKKTQFQEQIEDELQEYPPSSQPEFERPDTPDLEKETSPQDEPMEGVSGQPVSEPAEPRPPAV